MIIFEELKAAHVLCMKDLLPIHSGEITEELAESLERIGGFACIEDGEVLGVGGIMPKWDGVGLAWAWLTRKWTRHAKVITIAIDDHLSKSEFHRIEAGVKVGYDKGARWMKHLGFEMETPVARMWGPDKGDYSLYVRLRNG